MRPTDVTVVMCTYNGEQYVEEQLQTILRQTFPPAEIIVSDDGSTDKTLHVIESVAATADLPIRVYRNATTLGYADNFLRACSHVRTRYVAFSDQDDEWAPTKLETSRQALARTGSVLCVHAVQLIDATGVLLGDNRSSTPAQVITPLRSNPFGNYYGFTMLFERALLDRIPAEERGKDPHTRDASLPHDRWIYFLASTFGRTVVVDECLARYRQHDRQLYGGEKSRTRAQRLATKLATGRGQAHYLAEAAAHNAALLESHAPSVGDPLWRTGAERWRNIESHFASRARLYDDVATSARLAQLAGNIRSGVYRSFSSGGLSWRRLAEDLAVTAAMGVSSVRSVAERPPPA